MKLMELVEIMSKLFFKLVLYFKIGFKIQENSGKYIIYVLLVLSELLVLRCGIVYT